MFKKILIANRGEIALRIIRTCKEMGIKSVALCPQKGLESQFLETSFADEFYYLEREGAKGYLDIKRILEIAKKVNVDAVHPGYGFLSENWTFAKLCEKQKIKFIGPHYSVLKKLEDKMEAKKLAQKLKIPTLPMSKDPVNSLKDLKKWIFLIRPPFVLKAKKGGGGIGIRAINGDITLGEIFTLALGVRRQMSSAFADTEFFLEKYIPEAKHIEVQILGDGKNFLHLFERECSIQRRFQKLLEEAPSPSIDDELRKKITEFSLVFAKALKYETVGTFEFLLDKNRNVYFMEVNPRIQVEHPVTEAITGIDLVEYQIRISQGEKIKISQEDIKKEGWAIEARINSEDPLKNFKPSPGKIEKLFLPGGQGVFVHTFLHEGQEILPYFDSLLAKIIGYGKTREEAISKLKRALKEIVIEGVTTNLSFFEALFQEKEFLEGTYTTDFIEKSKILEKIKASDFCRTIPLKKVEIKEKEIADLVWQIYQKIRKNSPSEQGEPEKISNWKKAHWLESMQE
jgi:acetyl-CoA carboxylase biotin carboxylase subunit